MKRREFVLLAGSAALVPFAAQAQQRTTRVIGFLHTSVVSDHSRRAFIAGMADAGYTEGRNLAIVYRFAEGRPERLPDLALELVQRNVEVIFAAGGSVAAKAAKAASTTTPIVFLMGDADPVEAGLVASVGRPGSNLTGVTLLGGALGPKRVEILRELVPGAKTIAVLVNPRNRSSQPYGAEVQAAIRAAGQQAIIVEAAAATDFTRAFARITESKAQALIVTADNVFTRAAAELVAFSARQRLPAIYQWRSFVKAGGLISYGASLNEAYRQAAAYIARILKGDKPADLPIVQPARFALVINLKTAKALGLAVPSTLLAWADEVIE